MMELKKCPFCGGYDCIETGVVNQPDAWYDSGLRGEQYSYVMCVDCGCILKANNLASAIKTWNKRDCPSD